MRCKQFLTLSAATLILAAALTGCGASSSTASSAATSEAASSVAAASEAASEAAATLPDGVYTADFETDSSMVHANEACDGKGTLTVKDGQMTFHVSLASKKIVNLYLGSAADADANKADWLLPTTDIVTYSDGTTEEVYGYDIPLTAVDEDFALAILGTKGKWYDHPCGRRVQRQCRAGGRFRPRQRGQPRCSDRRGWQDDRCDRLEQPQLRLYDRGRREVSAHQHRGQLHL